MRFFEFNFKIFQKGRLKKDQKGHLLIILSYTDTTCKVSKYGVFSSPYLKNSLFGHFSRSVKMGSGKNVMEILYLGEKAFSGLVIVVFHDRRPCFI